MRDHIIYPSFDLEVLAHGGTLFKVSCYFSLSKRLWLSEGTMLNTLGFFKQELKKMRSENHAFIDPKTKEYFYDFAYAFSESVVLHIPVSVMPEITKDVINEYKSEKHEI